MHLKEQLELLQAIILKSISPNCLLKCHFIFDVLGNNSMHIKNTALIFNYLAIHFRLLEHNVS